jgi:hypothetical protein
MIQSQSGRHSSEEDRVAVQKTGVLVRITGIAMMRTGEVWTRIVWWEWGSSEEDWGSRGEQRWQ